MTAASEGPAQGHVGTPGEQAGPARGRPVHPALVLSCAFGAVGMVLLLAGAVLSSDTVFVAGAVAGALSLGAALYWRSELIRDWRERNPRRRR